MPVWTYTCDRDLDTIITVRELMALAREDRMVVSASLTFQGGLDDLEDSDRRWIFRVDTGDNPRPLNEELWEFLRTLSQPLDGRFWLSEFMPSGEPNRNGDIYTQELREQTIPFLRIPFPTIRRLAQAMDEPLRARRDYTSVARQTFLVDQLPDGALPFYGGPPSALIPNWMVPGVWMENIETGIVAQVFSVNESISSVTLDGWRTAKRIVIDLRGFNPETWRVILEPKEGLPWYDRLDLV